MSSNENGDEINRNHQQLDLYGQLEAKLKARNKIIRNRELTIPCALVDDSDLSDILADIPHANPHKHLQDNYKVVSALMENIRQTKRTSELETNFSVDEERNQEDEVNRAISRLRQQSGKLLKKIINTQIGFNECLNENLLLESSENNDYVERHLNLIEQTCKFDRGVESVFCCNEETLNPHVDDNLKIENVDEFKNAFNKLALGVLSTVYDRAAKKSKNHEHLLSIKNYNKPRTDEFIVNVTTTAQLDPFTRQLITKPVHNKICKHVYDQESISLMFKGKHFIHCPHIGCGNKHFTKKDILYEDDSVNE